MSLLCLVITCILKCVIKICVFSHNSTRKWYGHGQRSKTSKTVQAVVYCSVILISLVGILIKYFVTHYETSQIKAQEQLRMFETFINFYEF